LLIIAGSCRRRALMNQLDIWSNVSLELVSKFIINQGSTYSFAVQSGASDLASRPLWDTGAVGEPRTRIEACLLSLWASFHDAFAASRRHQCRYYQCRYIEPCLSKGTHTQPLLRKEGDRKIVSSSWTETGSVTDAGTHSHTPDSGMKPSLSLVGCALFHWAVNP
jgi:hypothetical protein